MKQLETAFKSEKQMLVCNRIKKWPISGHLVSLREKSGSWRQPFQRCSTNFRQSEHFRNVRGKEEADEIQSHLGNVKMLGRKLRLLAQRSCNATLSSLSPLLFQARSLAQEPVVPTPTPGAAVCCQAATFRFPSPKLSVHFTAEK